MVVVCSFVLLLSALYLPKIGDLGSNPDSTTSYHSLLGFSVLLCKLVVADGGGIELISGLLCLALERFLPKTIQGGQPPHRTELQGKVAQNLRAFPGSLCL